MAVSVVSGLSGRGEEREDLLGQVSLEDFSDLRPCRITLY